MFGKTIDDRKFRIESLKHSGACYSQPIINSIDEKEGVQTPNTGILKKNKSNIFNEIFDQEIEDIGKRSVTFELSSPEKDMSPNKETTHPFKIEKHTIEFMSQGEQEIQSSEEAQLPYSEADIAQQITE